MCRNGSATFPKCPFHLLRNSPSTSTETPLPLGPKYASGDWAGWIGFCLRGVVEQAKDTLHRYERLITLNRDFHQRVNALGTSVRHARLVDEFFLSPVIQVTHARDLTGVTYPTARTDLRTLEELGIVKELIGPPQITYACMPIVEVVYLD